jgi:poly-beta-1,6-N-acetyl-D-glucosamine synthase
MSVLVGVFWICFAIVAFTYVGYPLVVGVWARLFGRPVRRAELDERRGLSPPTCDNPTVTTCSEGINPSARQISSFTVLLAAHNEENNIERRIAELRRQIAATGLDGDVIVIADGCTDRTVERAEAAIADERRGLSPPACDEPTATTRSAGTSPAARHGNVRVLAWPENRGKAAALSRGASQATGDILVFADVRQTWADDAIVRMLGNFADPAVGAVSGDLVLESEPGVLAGVGLYWRFEKWLRRQESRCWSQVGVTGAIAAGRRELFETIPDGTVLDDVCWPLRIAMRGYRVIHDESARAFDRLPEKPVAEFRRKVRTLAGNLQLAGRIPASLIPWRNRVWTAWIGHKLARLVVPWALLGLFVTSVFIDSPWALGFAVVQAACYGLALAGLTPWLRKSRLPGAAASFLVLNAAAWCAFWVWATGRTAASWRKVDYRRTVLLPTNEVPS